MATPSFIHFDTKCKGGGQQTPGQRRGRGPIQQSELASVFDKNGKGVSMATPGHRRGGQRTPGHRGGPLQQS
jgi:hypothetical protein